MNRNNKNKHHPGNTGNPGTPRNTRNNTSGNIKQKLETPRNTNKTFGNTNHGNTNHGNKNHGNPNLGKNNQNARTPAGKDRFREIFQKYLENEIINTNQLSNLKNVHIPRFLYDLKTHGGKSEQEAENLLYNILAKDVGIKKNISDKVTKELKEKLKKSKAGPATLILLEGGKPSIRQQGPFAYTIAKAISKRISDSIRHPERKQEVRL